MDGLASAEQPRKQAAASLVQPEPNVAGAGHRDQGRGVMGLHSPGIKLSASGVRPLYVRRAGRATV